MNQITIKPLHTKKESQTEAYSKNNCNGLDKKDSGLFKSHTTNLTEKKTTNKSFHALTHQI